MNSSILLVLAVQRRAGKTTIVSRRARPQTRADVSAELNFAALCISPKPQSIHCRSGLQIDLFPLAADDALADLGGCFAFFRLVVGIVKLFQADVALGAMRTFKATVQAVVPHAPVAVAVTGLLMD